MNTKKIYRDSLYQALGSIMPPTEVSSALERFDRLANFGLEMAIEVTLNSLGLQESRAGVKEYIAAELEKFSKGKTVQSSAILRLREIVKKLNSNIKKCGVTVDGKELEKFEMEKALVKLAPCLQEQQFTFTATATENGEEKVKLILEVIG